MNKTVLIVDDDPSCQMICRCILEPLGYKIHLASDGEEVMRLLRSRSIKTDLILLDVFIPGKDGFDICKELKRDPELASIPVVFMSAINEPSENIRGLEAGGAAFVSKPFDAVGLRAVVQSQIL